jgi:hypothetical protein
MERPAKQLVHYAGATKAAIWQDVIVQPGLLCGSTARRVSLELSSMPKRTRATAMLRILAGVLCVFLIGASLDAIPDPPAVTQHTQHSLASQVDQNRAVPAALLNGAPISFFQPTACGASNAQPFEATSPCVGLVLVSHATDTSPPLS